MIPPRSVAAWGSPRSARAETGVPDPGDWRLIGMQVQTACEARETRRHRSTCQPSKIPQPLDIATISRT
jgi:hypothetical protein